MSLNQNSLRLLPIRPPRKVEFTHQIERLWDEEGWPEWRVRVLCKATYSARSYSRFVWWKNAERYPTEERARLAAKQVLQAAQVMCGCAQ